MQKNNSANKIVLITGTSHGIGTALAECFATDGCDLILTGRDAASIAKVAAGLQQHYAITTSTYAFDLTDEDALENFIRTIQQSHPRIDCLVKKNKGQAWTLDK